MGYRLWMRREIHDWLTRLRADEPGLARLVGEAVLAVLDAGGTLGPPLVIPLESVLRRPDDLREDLDLAYQRQLETLSEVRRGVADVATSRKRVELASNQLEQQIAKLESQRPARARGRPRRPGQRGAGPGTGVGEAGVRERLSSLHRQLHTLTAEEERLSTASQRLQIRVETFRVQKETIEARSRRPKDGEGSRGIRQHGRGHQRPGGHGRGGGRQVRGLQCRSRAPEAEAETEAGAGELLQEIRDLTRPPWAARGRG